MKYYKSFSLFPLLLKVFLNFIFTVNYDSFSIQRFLVFYTWVFLKSESLLQHTCIFTANILLPQKLLLI